MSALPNCDRCGRFMVPGSPGTSWVNVPYSDVSIGDERDRCARCTERHGPARCGPDYVAAICEGRAAASIGEKS